MQNMVNQCFMDYRENSSREVREGDAMFPEVPFQMVIMDREYSAKYGLPYKFALTVTHVRYSLRHKEVRYGLLNALFDFPWKEESCEVLELYHTN